MNNIIIHETPVETDYKFWFHTYNDHLINLYKINIINKNQIEI